MIAILCPTRDRDEQCNRMIASAVKTSTDGPVTFYIANHEMYAGKPVTMLLPENMPTAHKWNMLAEEALKDPANNLFMLGADDMVFETPGWDKALIDHYNVLENKIHVYALQDSRDINGTPHPIVTREYIDAMGYFVPPIFMHWYVDSWTVDISTSSGCFTHLKEFKLNHIKPSDEGKPDQTHSRIRDFGWHERDKWVAEKMAHVLEYEKFRLMNGGKPLMYGIPGQ